MKPRFAIIGTGSMAATMTALFRASGISVNAVVSRTPQRASAFAKRFDIAAGPSDLAAVLNRADIDAVYVANAASEHAATVVAALKAGKAVLCEKPLAVNESEVRQIIETSRQTNVLCMEGLWTLALPAYQQFITLARSGDWGEPRSLTASFAYPADETQPQRPDSALSTGVLLDRSVYLIALALKTFGPVQQVNATLRFNASGIEDEAFLQLTHANGAHCQLAASFNSLMPNSATLSCSRGLIQLQPPLIGSEGLTTYRAHPSYAAPAVESAPRAQDKLKARLRESSRMRLLRRILDKPRSHHFSYGSSGYQSQLSHFLTLMETKKTQSEIVPLELSLEVIKIIDEAKRLTVR